jgi:NAD(P)-dependent dehydrogenase (short-subunit alcohol dehydrogenase family)
MSAAIAKQPRNLPLLATPEICSSKIYIVTGANSGLGLEAARHLVNAGAAKVILAVRNAEAGNKAVKDIELSTGTSGVTEVWLLDLSSFDSVKAFAHKAATELGRIDAVIQNAGVAMSERVLAEGHNMTVTVNVLSTILLGLLLLPKLKDVAQRYKFAPRLTFVSSIAGFDVQALWETIRDSPVSKMDSEDMNQMPM